MNSHTIAHLMATRFGRDRWNEHVKLLASLLNAIAVAAIVGAFVAPLISGRLVQSDSAGLLLLAGLVLHGGAQAVLRYIVSRE